MLIVNDAPAALHRRELGQSAARLRLRKGGQSDNKGQSAALDT